jgi:hypothetical protein
MSVGVRLTNGLEDESCQCGTSPCLTALLISNVIVYLCYKCTNELLSALKSVAKEM